MPDGFSNTEQASLAVKAKCDFRRDTLSELYARYRDELVAFVRQRVGSGPPEPEDVAQEAFASYAAISCQKAIDNPRAFLYRTAANYVVDHHRHTAVQARHLAQEQYVREILGEAGGLSPEIVLLDKERFAIVMATVRKMPRQRRRYFLLNRFRGLSYAQIARQCFVSESGVRRHVLRAIRDCDEAIERAGRLESEER